ncbi:triple functional domain protein-like isoform X4 [Aphis craccivora]|uniref:Triple functional domain protein-like isoform X4 n=1 Tax=Aphis craccivora TaxID=307492 RepID=A0A6G0ZLM6_APHCR|nr:triple functional domain protein-like isoform X4 [Aphis craccivora]
MRKTTSGECADNTAAAVAASLACNNSPVTKRLIDSPIPHHIYTDRRAPILFFKTYTKFDYKEIYSVFICLSSPMKAKEKPRFSQNRFSHYIILYIVTKCIKKFFFSINVDKIFSFGIKYKSIGTHFLVHRLSHMGLVECVFTRKLMHA